MNNHCPGIFHGLLHTRIRTKHQMFSVGGSLYYNVQEINKSRKAIPNVPRVLTIPAGPNQFLDPLPCTCTNRCQNSSTY